MSVMEQIVENQGARIRELEEKLRTRWVDVNARMTALVAKYGRVTIDFFAGTNGWRIWFQGYHQHLRFSGGIGGSHSGFAAEGTSIEGAIERLERTAANVPPSAGFHCRKGCPYHTDDLY